MVGLLSLQYPVQSKEVFLQNGIGVQLHYSDFILQFNSYNSLHLQQGSSAGYLVA